MVENIPNPFSSYRAEKLTNSIQFGNNFSPRPLLQLDIQKLFEEKNIILIGHPGSGKSMILKSIDFENLEYIIKSDEIRFKEIKEFLLEHQEKKQILGVYFSIKDKFDASSFKDLLVRGIKNDEYFFITYFSLFLIHKFISFLFSKNELLLQKGILKDPISNEIMIEKINHFEITKINKNLTISELAEYITNSLSELSYFKRTLLNKKIDETKLNLKRTAFFSLIINGILENLFIKDYRIIFLIDDMQDIPDKMLSVFYDILSNQYEKIEFKIGTRPRPAYTSDLDKRDLEIIDLEASHYKYATDYRIFALEVANMRISQIPFFKNTYINYETIIQTLNIDDEFEKIQDIEQAYKFYENTFLDYLSKNLSKSEMNTIEIERQKIPQELEKLIFSASIMRRIQKKDSIRNAISYAEKQLNNKTQFKRFLTYCLPYKSGDNKIYCGIPTIIDLSSFIIKNFIEINYNIFQSFIYDIIRKDLKDQSIINAEKQDEIIRRLSIEENELVSKMINGGLNFSKLITFFVKDNRDQYDLPFSYLQGRSGLGFDKKFSKKIDSNQIIINARSLGYLLRFNRPKGKYSSGDPKEKTVYYFNRLLMVKFNFPIIKGGYSTYHEDDIVNLLEGKKESIKTTKKHQKALSEFTDG